MLTDEIKKNWDIIRTNYDILPSDVYKQQVIGFAKLNNSVFVGDTISDVKNTIIVETIQYTFSAFDGIPICLYVGKPLKKNGLPKRNSKITTVSQVYLRSIQQPIVKLQDCDGHWYWIPKVLSEDFKTTNEVFYSIDYMDDPVEFDEFSMKYEHYRTHGSEDCTPEHFLACNITPIEYGKE